MSTKSEVKYALTKIKKFCKINNLRISPTVKINYKLDCLGVFYWNHDQRSLYVNPKMCRHRCTTTRKVNQDGYINSYTLTNVIIHEFGHLIDERYSLNKEFASEVYPAKFNRNCGSYTEIFAESFSLFIFNPYLLKLIAPDIHEFFQCRRLKSPTPCSKKTFISLWRKWDDKTKNHCLAHLGITVKDSQVLHNPKKSKKYLQR